MYKPLLIFMLMSFFLPLAGAQSLVSDQPTSQNLEQKAMDKTLVQNWSPQVKELSELNLSLDVVKYSLENGMTVLLHEDHSVPMVTHHMWYKVGSRNERPGITGISHMLEHMLFKGAKKYSGKDFDRILHENGVRNNAFTSYDYTGYYFNLPSGKLELIMDIESDRMAHLKLQEKDLVTEREVVAEERRFRVDNNPAGLVHEVSFGTVFKVHPYRWPVIGYMKDVQNYKLQDLKDYFKVNYAPNNAVLVIAGDIDINATKKLIQKYYGPLKPQEVPELNVPQEPAQKGQRSSTVRKNIQSPILSVAYKTVPAGHEDMYALDLLSNILGSGPSSRLFQRLVYRNQLATSASSYSYTPMDPGVFVVSVDLKPDADVEMAKKLVYSSLYKLRSGDISKDELVKAKNQVMKNYVDELLTLSDKARALATNEIMFGDYKRLFNDLQQYQKVTVEDLKAVAEKYLQPQQRSVITLLPKQ